MYTSHFRLRAKPFNLTPDPHLFYANHAYQAVHDEILAGIRTRKDFVLLSGQAGTGKTVVLLKVMHSLDALVDAVLVTFTNLDFEEFVSYVCDELELLEGRGSQNAQKDALGSFLAARQSAGGSVAILIDEAQNLSDDVLLNLGRLTDLVPGALQVVMVGQSELDTRLRHGPLAALHQRIALRCELRSLPSEGVGPYVYHRLSAVGNRRDDLFSSEAIEHIARHTRGLPRLINVVCEDAMQIACRAGKESISADIIEQAIRGAESHGAIELGLSPAPPGAAIPPPPAAAPARMDVGSDASADRLESMHRKLEAAYSPVVDDPAASASAAKAGFGSVFDGLKLRLLGLRDQPVWVGAGGALLVAIAALTFLPSGPQSVPAPSDARVTRAVDGSSAPSDEAITASNKGIPAAASNDSGARPLVSAASISDSSTSSSVEEHETPPRVVVPAADRGALIARLETYEKQATEREQRLEDTRRLAAEYRVTIQSQLKALEHTQRKYGELERRFADLQNNRAEVTAELERVRGALEDTRRTLVAEREKIAAQNTVIAELEAKRDRPQARPSEVKAASPSRVIAEATARKVMMLLARAEKQVAAKDLTIPPGGNALETYRQVLAIVPENEEARRGIEGIKDKFIKWADGAKRRGQSVRARRYTATARMIESETKEAQLVRAGLVRPLDSKPKADRVKPDETTLKVVEARLPASKVPPTVAENSLMSSASEGDERAVELILSAGMTPDVRDDQGATALIHAAKHGHRAVVQKLIEAGADVNAHDREGNTALMLAAGAGHSGVTALLLARGAEANATSVAGETALLQAAWNDRGASVRQLLERRVDVNLGNKEGWTPLMYAAINGHRRIVKVLVDHGADVNAKNHEGETALAAAAWNGHMNVVRMLLDHTVSIDLKNTDGWTALMNAAVNGHTDIVRELLTKGADVNAKNTDGWTALMKAAWSGHPDVVQLLLDKGADQNLKNNDGETALNGAKTQGHRRVVEVLERSTA